MNAECLKKLEAAIKKSKILENSLFLQEHEKIYKLTKLCYYNMDWSSHQGPMSYCSRKDSLKLAKEYLETIDTGYGTFLQKDYLRNRIKINPAYDGSRYIMKHLQPFHLFDIYYERIAIKESNTLRDSRDIVHEYLHKLSLNVEENGDGNENYHFYLEMVSILGEFRFLNYLEVKNIVSSSELELLREIRKASYCHNARSYLLCEPFVDTLIKKGSLTEKNIRECTDFYDSLNNVVLVYAIKNFKQTPTLSYRYLLGTPLAATLCDISNEDFKMLIENLNKVERADYDKMLSRLSNDPVLASMKNQFESRNTEKIKRR